MSNSPRPGRRRSVWWRKSRKQWYTTMDGVQTPLGVTDPRAYDAAVQALARLLADRQAATTESATGGATVAEAVSNHMEVMACRSLMSHRTCKHYAKRFTDQFGPTLVADLTSAAVQAWTGSLGWSGNSCRNLLVLVEGVMKRAGRPMSLEKPPRTSRGEDAVIPEPVYRRAVAAADGDLGPLLTVLWETGARPGELRTLTAEMVHWDAGQAVLKAHKTARVTGRKRLIPLSTEAVRVLVAQRAKYDGTGLLFRSRRGTAFTVPGLAQAVWRLGKKVGHPGLTAYGFRHTLATRALEAGIPDTHVAGVLGHSGTAMIHKHYSHVAQNSRLLRDVVDRLSKGRQAGQL